MLKEDKKTFVIDKIQLFKFLNRTLMDNNSYLEEIFLSESKFINNFDDVLSKLDEIKRENQNTSPNDSILENVDSCKQILSNLEDVYITNMSIIREIMDDIDVCRFSIACNLGGEKLENIMVNYNFLDMNPNEFRRYIGNIIVNKLYYNLPDNSEIKWECIHD